ncbi:TetR/AcrR family transcriptional regulator [Streptomyces thermolineatus]|uniref:TetR/AcrR family transcriptional regulator n=1 Tax=Streptomyces thermolineatus TaxID=44033 RepID=UPI00384FFAF5
MTVRPPGFGRTGADRREKARDLLVETALGLFAERGYIGVRVEDIAKAAGISRATFYKYFSEREEILAELFARLLGRDPVSPPEGSVEETPERIERLLVGTAERMLRDEVLARFVYTLPIRHAALLGEGARPPALDTVEGMLAEASAAGVVRSDVPSALLAAHVGRAYEAAMRDWAEGRSDDAPAQVRLLLDLAFRGISGG